MSPPISGRAAQLLLVEDSHADARYVREVFKDAKLRNHLHHAPDAETALELLRSQTLVPDLVLLDMHLPGMQGAALVAELRADPRTAALPIVLLAPSELHAERLRAERIDAQFCLLKPVDVRALFDIVSRIDSLAVAVVTDGEAA